MADDNPSHEDHQRQTYEDAETSREQLSTLLDDPPYEFTVKEIAKHINIALASVRKTIDL
jgi:response regulator of citrate/malate metabolism